MCRNHKFFDPSSFSETRSHNRHENLEEKEILVNTVANNDEPHDTLEKGLAAKQENSKDSDEITEHALEDIKVSQSTKCRPAIDLINSVSSHLCDKTVRIRSI